MTRKPFGQEMDLRDASPEFRDRFWSKVQIGAKDECWPWLAHCKASGYGQFVLRKGVFVTASRVALALSVGVIPEGHVACHTCDNPPCCNPSHLFLGTQADNALDMVGKGRATRATGERHQCSRLTWAAVERIRSEPPRPGLRADLAREYGVSWNTIKSVVDGKTWRVAA